MLRQAWTVPNGVGPDAEPAHDKARGLHELVARLWEDLNHPCEERIVSRALDYADRRAAASLGANPLKESVEPKPLPPRQRS